MKKTARILSTILLSAAASTSAFAGATDASATTATKPGTAVASSASFKLPADTKVGGVELKKGSYRVEWSGEGSEVQVSMRQGKKELVRVAGTVVSLDKKEEGDTLLSHDSGAGVPTATEIRFAGKRFALKLADTPLTAAAAKPTAK